MSYVIEVIPLLLEISMYFFIFGIARRGPRFSLSLIWVYLRFVLVGGVTHSIFYVVNVYSSCTLIEKIIMWDDLVQRRLTLWGEVWCVYNNFNYVRSRAEMIGVKGSLGKGETWETLVYLILLLKWIYLCLEQNLLGSNLIGELLVGWIKSLFWRVDVTIRVWCPSELWLWIFLVNVLLFFGIVISWRFETF